jgi:hypothetical protein
VREAQLGQQAVRIAGVGGVCTREGFRRLGFARAGMACAATYMKNELAADFGLLFCNRPNYRFYENCGWTRFPGEVFVEQPAGRIAFNISAPYGQQDTRFTRISLVKGLCERGDKHRSTYRVGTAIMACFVTIIAVRRPSNLSARA